MYLHVVDAATGRVLYRRTWSSDTGQVWDNYPGAPSGGAQVSRGLPVRAGCRTNSPRLAGNVAHVYNDVNDDNVAQPSEEITPSEHGQFNFPFTDFNAGRRAVLGRVPSARGTPRSPTPGRPTATQNAVQVFYFLGKFHDHLAAAPIGFTRAAGNFEAVDGDAVQAKPIDGANIADGLPDGHHIDNANMGTPPDGIPPRMQMYLFHDPARPGRTRSSPATAATRPTSSTTSTPTACPTGSSSTPWATRRSATSRPARWARPGATGTPWTSWSTRDFQPTPPRRRAARRRVRRRGQRPDPHPAARLPGRLHLGRVPRHAGRRRRAATPTATSAGSSAVPRCTPTARSGARRCGTCASALGLEAHRVAGDPGDGALAGQPVVPGHAQLDPAGRPGGQRRQGPARRSGSVFAARGMGYFAGAIDGDDTAPVEDFSMPPRAGHADGQPHRHGRPTTGHRRARRGRDRRLRRARLRLRRRLRRRHRRGGHYTISGIFPGTYPKVFAARRRLRPGGRRPCRIASRAERR